MKTAPLIRNHFPDALWMCSLLSFGLFAMSFYGRKWMMLSLFTGVLIAITLEMMQLLNTISGTGDVKDLFIYLSIAGIYYLTLLKTNNNKTYTYVKTNIQ